MFNLILTQANLAQAPLQLFGIPGMGVTPLDEASFSDPSPKANNPPPRGK
jgi:hypothetical protein